MSAMPRSEGAVVASRWRQFVANVIGTNVTLFRSPRPPGRKLAWPPVKTLVTGVVTATVVVVATMILVDGWSLASIRQTPNWLQAASGRYTDLGLAGWFLWPVGLALIALAIIDAPPLQRFSRGILAAWGVRLGFVFAAIAVPGLFAAIIKRMIGRGRPPASAGDPWTYLPFVWKVEYASFPSGHTTTAFAVLIALGTIWPWARPILWVYALLIAASRVLVYAHHPSDVVAGALVGLFGALLVRNWFAARRLGFVVDAKGAVRPLPGPSWRRIRATLQKAI